MISVRDNAALKDATIMYVRTATGLVSVETAQMRTGIALSKIFERAIRAAANPDYLTGISYPRRVSYTGACAVQVTGGTAPYSYAWSSGFVSAMTPTSATTYFRIPAGFEGQSYASCTVTDASGRSATIPVTIEIELSQGSGIIQ